MSVGLVLEGGGQRGAFTAGVLQALYSESIHIDYVAGVSAGALVGMNYISGQPRRNYSTFVDYAADPRYMGFDHLRESGSLFNFDFLLGTLVYDLMPFDFERFYSSPCRLRIGTTDCRTGKAVWFDKEDLAGDRRLTVMRASASLPLMSRIEKFRGYELMDGGLADPIPIERSIADGNDYHIIIMTRNADYEPKRSSTLGLCRRVYADYPKFVRTLEARPVVYEKQRQLAYDLQRQGKAVVIQPIAPLRVGRTERRIERLAALYDTAMTEVAGRMNEIRALIEKDRQASQK